MDLSIEHIEILLLVAALVSMGARALKLPYTIGLVIAGVIVALLPSTLNINITKELIFTAFLPPLIFEAAYAMSWRVVKKDFVVTLTLATVGVLLSVLVLSAGVHYLIGWSWPAALIVGVLLSATDPVSVIATFKEMKVKGRLRMLVEAESLFNDGTAAVLFGIALALVTGGAVTGGFVLKYFVLTVAGGLACGAIIAFLILLIAGRTTDHLEEITLTTIAAYGSFLVAEHFHFSGVLATLAAGMIVGNIGVLGAISPRGREAVESFWEYAAFVANSLIFLIIGIGLTHQNFAGVIMPVLVVTVLAIAGRAAAVYLTCAVFTKTRHKVDAPSQHVLFWGGLRGALSLALALGLPANTPHRDDIRTVIFAAVAFSIIVQGLTLIPLLRRLGITAPAALGEEPKRIPSSAGEEAEVSPYADEKLF